MDKHVAPFGHIDYEPIRLCIPLNAACMLRTEAANAKSIVRRLTGYRIENTTYCTLGEHSDHFTTEIVKLNGKSCNLLTYVMHQSIKVITFTLHFS